MARPARRLAWTYNPATMPAPAPLATAALTAVAMAAFAANSLLCRGALGGHAIDPTSFTTVRIVSGAIALSALAGASRRSRVAGSWPSAAALFLYAIVFSWAYTRIPAGVGALLLFGAVQVTMLVHALRSGIRLRPGEWTGFTIALAGLGVLTRPGLAAPDPAGAALMLAAGAGWGVYSIRGRGQEDPLGVTAGNFLLASVPAVALSAASAGSVRWHWSTTGIMLATASGVLASGAGYAIWYTALRGLSPTTAAIVQLSAPLLAAIGGVLVLGESLTLRLVVATPLLLGGIALAAYVRGK
jgi:drug/metabolite transporter (DMT)-like permease